MASGAGEGTGLSGTSIAALAGGVGVVVVAAIVFFLPGEEPPAPAEDAVVAEPAETAETAEEPESPEAAAVEPAEDETVVEADPTFTAPRFDQIRVAPDGATVIAGQAPAGSEVTMILEGAEVAEARSSATGDFAAILTLEPSDVPRIMSLLAITPDGTEVPGDETVIIAPFGVVEEDAPVAVAEADTAIADEVVAETDATEDVASTDTDATAPTEQAVDAPQVVEEPTIETAEADDGTADATEDDAADLAEVAPPAEPETTGTDVTELALAETSEAPAPETEAADASAEPVAATEETETEVAPQPQAEAPAVVVAGSDGVRVVQGGAPEAQTEVQIDAITYTTDGDVALSGRGPSEGRVQILLNNQEIQLGEIGPDGQWSLELPDVDPGTYTLTVAQLSAEGEITSRVDTPFLREDPARVAASPMRVEEGVSVITVQPGFTLWGIAEANFGDGIAYVQIFQENRDSIRDPDLIFPGQIFQLPDLPRETAVP